jgi:membrane protease YdiL (CAAX protease family)
MNTLGLILQTFALGLLPQFIKNIFEEFPWRGYLTPKVYSLRLNDFVGHLIVGFVWGAWHIPYFLYFLDRATIRDYTTLNLAAFIPLAIMAMMSWAIVYGEIRLLTNSVWPTVLMHMVEDAFVTPLLLEGYVQLSPGMDWLVSPVVGIISIVLFATLGVGLHQWRKRKLPVARNVK